MEALLWKTMGMLKVESLDDETIGMIERVVVLRIATKHINLWILQLQIKRREISELAWLIKQEEIKKELIRKRTSKGGKKDAPISSPRR